MQADNVPSPKDHFLARLLAGVRMWVQWVVSFSVCVEWPIISARVEAPRQEMVTQTRRRLEYELFICALERIERDRLFVSAIQNTTNASRRPQSQNPSGEMRAAMGCALRRAVRGNSRGLHSQAAALNAAVQNCEAIVAKLVRRLKRGIKRLRSRFGAPSQSLVFETFAAIAGIATSATFVAVADTS